MVRARVQICRRHTHCEGGIKDDAMKFRQMLLSLVALVLVVGGLAYIDPRVHDKLSELASSGGGVASWDNQLLDIGATLVAAIRYQSIENAPLMIFAVVGAVLFLFMIRT
jgi:hypothetical protein